MIKTAFQGLATITINRLSKIDFLEKCNAVTGLPIILIIITMKKYAFQSENLV
jgi:hypothetical protein